MTEGNNNVNIVLGGLAVLGIGIGGLTLASNNEQIRNDTNTSAQAESVINLPATNEKVNGLENRLNNAIQDINDQINRRELETYGFIETLDSKQDEKLTALDHSQEIEIQRLVGRLERLEGLLLLNHHNINN